MWNKSGYLLKSALVGLSLSFLVGGSPLFATEGGVHHTDTHAPKTLEIILPKPPVPVKAIKVITKGSDYRPITQKDSKEADLLPKRYPPNYKPKGARSASVTPKKSSVGEAKMGRVCAYLVAPFTKTESVVARLKKAGYEIVAQSRLDPKGELTTLLITDTRLKKSADRPGRGFAATLRLLVDRKDRQVRITNPIYFLKAFLQEAYDPKLASEELQRLRAAFPNARESKARLKTAQLPRYCFMKGMPHYEDMVEVGKADKSETLVEKLRAYQGGKGMPFLLKLSKGRYLAGVTLKPTTASFIQKIGVQNALVLPYAVLIEGAKAKILDPKYAISIYYPMLKMSQFMMIAQIPEEIQNDVQRPFR